MTLSRVYGFWKFVSKLERRETRRYLEMFYILKFRELVRCFAARNPLLFSLSSFLSGRGRECSPSLRFKATVGNGTHVQGFRRQQGGWLDKVSPHPGSLPTMVCLAQSSFLHSTPTPLPLACRCMQAKKVAH